MLKIASSCFSFGKAQTSSISLFHPMGNQPKTPLRQRARSEAKTPLTPSILSGVSNISLASTQAPSRIFKPKSSTTAADPLIALQSKSRPSSPVKCIGSAGIPTSESYQRQAKGGVIRKGGVESRLDVVTLDYVPPPRHDVKRSKSTPAVVSLLILC
jgi:cell division cycle protein 20 (cofactor of APC complex)